MDKYNDKENMDKYNDAVLNDESIYKLLDTGDLELRVLPEYKDLDFDKEKQVQPCSIDLRLGDSFLRFNEKIDKLDFSTITTNESRIDLSNVLEKTLDNVDFKELPSQLINVKGKILKCKIFGGERVMKRYSVKRGEGIILKPGEVVFGQTFEYLIIPEICCGYIESRSRFARYGISIHVNGGFINPGFNGVMPLQLINHNPFPITIVPYVKIAQLLLLRTEKAEVPYSSKRQDARRYDGEKEASAPFLGWDEEVGKPKDEVTDLDEKKVRNQKKKSRETITVWRKITITVWTKITGWIKANSKLITTIGAIIGIISAIIGFGF